VIATRRAHVAQFPDIRLERGGEHPNYPGASADRCREERKKKSVAQVIEKPGPTAYDKMIYMKSTSAAGRQLLPQNAVSFQVGTDPDLKHRHVTTG